MKLFIFNNQEKSSITDDKQGQRSNLSKDNLRVDTYHNPFLHTSVTPFDNRHLNKEIYIIYT